MTARLEISIGPVQGFVTQSRRTRDLWASSYLLSFLSAHAMCGAAKAGGEIVQPEIEQDPLYLQVSGRDDGDPPKFGSLPNHFVVKVKNGQEHAKAVAQASVRAFHAAWGQVCNAVWDKFLSPVHELGNGTEIIWNRQVGTFWEIMWAFGEPGALARRKHWRSHQPPPEPGDKCVLNHDLQELSGYIRNRHREAQDNFWRSLRLNEFDLREKERLSAIALIKRLFPLVSQEALGWQVETEHWPSTLEIGADAEDPDKPHFYAVVLADGDRLGKLLAKMDARSASRCLATFTSGVRKVVEKHEGLLVYAGGDDVLAMLPKEQALSCTQAIDTAYRNAFAHTKVRKEATLSAAVVFAHGKLPLGQVLREAHRQLDVFAKDENGRDSLSAIVLKNSGVHCQWTTTWNRPSSRKAASESAISRIERLSALLKASGDESGLSSILIYRLRNLASRLCGWSPWEPGTWTKLVPEIDLRAFLHAEITHGFPTRTDTKAPSPSNATDVVWQLMARCRNEAPTAATPAPAEEVGVDALMLAHFLANPADIQ